MRTGYFVLVLLFGGLSSFCAGYSGGNGTAGNPYQIASKADLLTLGATAADYGKSFILTEDIDLAGETFTRAVIAPDTNSSTTTFEGTKFTGIFDGNGHTILNLAITGSGNYYVGLFGFVDTGGQVRNLYVKNIAIQGRDYTGGLAGGNNGTITYSYTAGSVNGQSYTGGLTGSNYSSGKISFCRMAGTVVGTSYVGGLSGSYTGTITSCCSSGTVSGNTYIGGLAGYGATSGTIDACYSLSDVGSLSSQYVGGLTGYSSNSYIRNCYSAGAVVGASAVGGFTGYYSSGSIEKCFWDTQSSGRSNGIGSGSSSGVVGKTTAEMKTLSTFANAGWNISDLNGVDTDWIFVTEGQSYPQCLYFVYMDPSVIVTLTGGGTQQSPYQIASPDDLVSLSRCGSIWNKYIVLTADLNMDGIAIYPIGNSVVPFKGNFDGQNHIISNLTLDFPNKDYVGLFGYVGTGGVITDLSVEDVNVFGKRYIGGLAGYNSKSAISDCHSTGLAAGGSSACIGGLIGFNIGGTVSSCSSSVDITGAGATLGGLAGCNFTGSTISNCFATGTITDNDPSRFGCCAGGLVGDNYHSTITDSYAAGNISATLASSSSSIHIGGLVGESRFGTITGSYATGAVYADALPVSGITCGGGLIGFNSSDNVNDCYAAGPVTFSCGSESAYYFGGMIGLQFEGTVRRCYSKGLTGSGGSVLDDNCVGGLAGLNLAGNFYGCVWDILLSGTTLSGGGRGLVTEQMKSMQIYQNAGWAGNGWIIADGLDYPHRIWEGTDGDDIPVSLTVELAGSGTGGDPYEIWTVDDFMIWGQYASVLDKHTQLMADLDLNGILLSPVGEYGPFTGTFDGNGHVIENVTITRPTANYVGFFGRVGAGGIITDLGVKNAVIAGGSYAGGLIGTSEGGTVSHCHVSGTLDGFSYLGGLIGSADGGTVSDCDSNVAVTVWNSRESCYIGGLIGYNKSAAVSRCYALGDIAGSDSEPSCIGGLAGYNVTGTITSSYAQGSVNGAFFVGGLVGYHADNSLSKIQKCYSTGRVTGMNFVGGLVGTMFPNAVVTSSFWDYQTSGIGTTGGGISKTTIEMKTLSTFASAGWDFANVWSLCEGTNYPRLTWQIPAGDFVCPDGVSAEDLEIFAGQWLMENCTSDNDYCGGVDVDNSGGVDLGDWAVFAGHWLEM